MTDQEIELLGRIYGMTGSQDVTGFARALLSKAIPEGYVVVPKEPEEKTITEMVSKFWNCPDQDEFESMKYAYHAIIPAAPSVEGEGA